MRPAEVVYGINLLNLGKVNTRGINQANKCMLMVGAVFKPQEVYYNTGENR